MLALSALRGRGWLCSCWRASAGGPARARRAGGRPRSQATPEARATGFGIRAAKPGPRVAPWPCAGGRLARGGAQGPWSTGRAPAPCGPGAPGADRSATP